MSKKYCPIVVLNGKLSRRSFRFWYRFRGLKEKVFRNIDICLAQSKSDYRKFLNLGVQNVQFMGNIKFFVGKSSVDVQLYERLLREVGNRRRWLANCTHEGEETIVIETHQRLKKFHPDLMTFLVVRHIERIGKITALLDSGNIGYRMTSQMDPITEGVEFCLHDSYGDLGTFFDFCRIIFMGGSLVDGIGGHTPAESIKHNCCIVTGPYIENNLMLFRELKSVDGCIVLENATVDSLFSAIDFLLTNPAEVERISKNAYVRSLQYSGVLDEIVDIIVAKLF
jgi:3-deoxy-D-manno-octulosonic-acid transferase